MFAIDLALHNADPADPTWAIMERLNGLRAYHDLLDEYVPLMQRQTILRATATARRLSESEKWEADHAVKTAQWVADEVIPVHFLNAHLLAVTAALEQSLAEIADFIQKREGSKLRLTDLKEQATLKRFIKYIEIVSRKDLSLRPEHLLGVEDAFRVRNAIAHGGGELRLQSDQRQKDLEQLVAKDIGLEIAAGRLRVSGRFLRNSLGCAEGLLGSAVHHIEVAYLRGVA